MLAQKIAPSSPDFCNASLSAQWKRLLQTTERCTHRRSLASKLKRHFRNTAPYIHAFLRDTRCSSGTLMQGLCKTYDGPPVTIIGSGRIGRAFEQMAGERALLIGREQRVPDASTADGAYDSWRDGPVLVATRNSDLRDVLASVPSNRRRDLVFLQNGMLFPWLEAERLLPDCTLALLYFSSANDDADPTRMRIVDGAGKTVAWGRWAKTVVEILESGGVRAAVIDDWTDFSNRTVEKLLWSSIFWLLSAALGGKPVGKIAEENRADVRELVADLLPIADAHVARFPEAELDNASTSSEAAESTTSTSAEKGATFPTSAGRAVSPEARSEQRKGEGSGRTRQESYSEDIPSNGNQARVENRRKLRVPAGHLNERSVEAGEEHERSRCSASPKSLLGKGEASDTTSHRIDRLVDSLCEYSLAIGTAVPSREMALAEFEWRNGWFLSKVPSPLHLMWLRRASVKAPQLPDL